jgi:chromodomain protein Y
LNTLPDPPPGVEVQGEIEYEVDAVLDLKIKNGKKYYLVRWLGYERNEDSWEPEENLIHAQDKLAAFHSRYDNQVETEGEM